VFDFFFFIKGGMLFISGIFFAQKIKSGRQIERIKKNMDL
jgi:hypothetical protein